MTVGDGVILSAVAGLQKEKEKYEALGGRDLETATRSSKSYLTFRKECG